MLRRKLNCVNTYIFILILLLLSCSNKPKSYQKYQVKDPVYGFETDAMKWEVQTYIDSRAFKSISWTNERAIEGKFSIKVMANLIGDDKENSKGEAFVDLRYNALKDKKGPLNLSNKLVKAYIFVPEGAYGERNRPNGLQVFAKDSGWRSIYGSWINLQENEWNEVVLKIDTNAPSGGYISEGFDPTQIIVIGVKMGTGSGSTATYNGPIYIDGVTW
jgi:hypothetical protein